MPYKRTSIVDGTPLDRSIEVSDAMARYCFAHTDAPLRDGTLEEGFTTYLGPQAARVPYASYEPIRDR